VSFHTHLFCSLFQALRPFRIEKIAKNFALRGRLQIFVEFSHGLREFCNTLNVRFGSN